MHGLNHTKQLLNLLCIVYINKKGLQIKDLNHIKWTIPDRLLQAISLQWTNNGVYTGLDFFFWTYSSCGASGLKFSLVLTPVDLVLKSGILKETKHIIQ